MYTEDILLPTSTHNNITICYFPKALAFWNGDFVGDGLDGCAALCFFRLRHLATLSLFRRHLSVQSFFWQVLDSFSSFSLFLNLLLLCSSTFLFLYASYSPLSFIFSLRLACLSAAVFGIILVGLLPCNNYVSILRRKRLPKLHKYFNQMKALMLDNVPYVWQIL